jgi:hypothetical protein
MHGMNKIKLVNLLLRSGLIKNKNPDSYTLTVDKKVKYAYGRNCSYG